MKVLLADDEESMRTLMRRLLVDEGYDFVAVNDGSYVMDAVKKEKPDIVLLDVMMPKLDGFTACRMLREENPSIAIVMLTARDEMVDKSIGFRAGADDYIIKPFEPMELLLRLEAIARRTVRRNQGADEREAEREDVVAGRLRVSFKGREVYLDEERLEFTAKEFDLLAVLLENPGHAFTKEQLRHRIWGDDYSGEDTNLAVLIHRIRKKVERDPYDPQYIKTVWGVGYRFEI